MGLKMLRLQAPAVEYRTVARLCLATVLYSIVITLLCAVCRSGHAYSSSSSGAPPLSRPLVIGSTWAKSNHDQAGNVVQRHHGSILARRHHERSNQLSESVHRAPTNIPPTNISAQRHGRLINNFAADPGRPRHHLDKRDAPVTQQADNPTNNNPTNYAISSSSTSALVQQDAPAGDSAATNSINSSNNNMDAAEQEILKELQRYYIVKQANNNAINHNNIHQAPLLPLPAPNNVTVTLKSWYPPIIKLNWCITELDGRYRPPVIDIRKQTFVNNKINATGQSDNSDSDSDALDAFNNDAMDDQQDLIGADLDEQADQTNGKSANSFVINIVNTTNDSDSNHNGTPTVINGSKTVTHTTNQPPLSSPTTLNANKQQQTQLTHNDCEYPASGIHSMISDNAPHKQQAKRGRHILRKALKAFQVTYNAVDSRFKTVEEYPPYLRSITLERLAPATKYELRIAALYVGGNKNLSQRVHFISPSDNESRRFRENSYRPIHRYPDEPPGPYKIRGEEVTIVVLVLICWMATVVIFINKWGKIRMLEPYQPAYREAPLFHHSSIHGPPTKGMSFCGGVVANASGVVGVSVGGPGGISTGPGGSLTTSGPIFFTTTGQGGLPSRTSSQVGQERSGVNYDLGKIGKQTSTGGYSGLRGHHHPMSLFASKAHAIAKASSVLQQSNWRYRAATGHRIPSLVSSGHDITQSLYRQLDSRTSRMCSMEAEDRNRHNQYKIVRMGSSTTSGQSMEQQQLDLSQNRQRRLLFINKKEQELSNASDDIYVKHNHHHYRLRSPHSSISTPSMPPTRTNSDEKYDNNTKVQQQLHHILIEPPSPQRVGSSRGYQSGPDCLSHSRYGQQQQHDQSLLLDAHDAYLNDRVGASRPRLSSVFVTSPYARAHRDSFAMLRAISQKKSKSAEDVACLSSLVLKIWNKDRNPLLQTANISKDNDNDDVSCVSTKAKRRRPRSSLTVAHL